MDELLLGIDEAGRGPVVGPMVVAGCLIRKSSESELKKLGVKDSKQLTAKRREFLVDEIKKRAVGFVSFVISSDEIDKFQSEGVNLNEIESLFFSKVVNSLNSGEEKISVFVDCPSISVLKWGEGLKMKIENLSNLNFSCEHKADSKHICVSAASILAKFEREKEMDKIKEKYGLEVGSGYCSDPSTKRFLEKNCVKYADEGIFRKCWASWKNACEKQK